ncbi:MAG: hypothetical protein D6768_15830 [Chloroflexi bacterium]|nr:MAG: hypothetical protein D6768_15830 [Chloroflexota bacterium]
MQAIATKLGLDTIRRQSVKDQLRRISVPLGVVLMAGLLVILGVYVLAQATGTPVSRLTRDPSAVTKVSFYIGLLSTMGIMLWSAAAAVCLFSARVLQRQSRFPEARFLLASGLFCLMLAADDAFLFHEEVFPEYLYIPEGAVYLGYAMIAGLYLLVFMPRILSTDYLLLVAAGAFLAGSIVLDRLLSFSQLETFAEDSLKFMGIALLLTYYAHTAAGMLGLPAKINSPEQHKQG